MDWNLDNIEDIVAFINSQLVLGKTMTDIEKEEFNANARVIHKRLIRLGYKKINNQYIKNDSKENSSKKVQEQCKEKPKKPVKEHIEKKNVIKENTISEEIDLNKLKEIIELLEPIKELLKINDGKSRDTKLDIPVITDVKQRTVKIDTEVLKLWDKFVKRNSNYKAQDLVSQALKEFMINHKK